MTRFSLALAAALCGGCSKPSAGTVIDKIEVPPWDATPYQRSQTHPFDRQIFPAVYFIYYKGEDGVIYRHSTEDRAVYDRAIKGDPIRF